MFRQFKAIAAAMPGHPAVVGDVRLTYGELACRADAIARAARQAGLQPGDRAALLSSRSADAVAAMLAVRQAGAAYVPVDPGLPATARHAVLADAAPTLILADHEVDTDIPVLRLDRPLPPAPGFQPPDEHGETPAYVMYTSGSTGTPKGVVAPCRGVLRLVRGADYVSLTAEDVVLQAAPLGFDASTLEVWGALLNGATLAILPDAVPSLDAIGAAIARHGVTVAWLTSGLFHAMVDHRVAALAPLRHLLAGGDVLSPSHVARALAALPDTVIINGYGPTENTTFTCCYRIPRDHPADRPVPIGRPIHGTDVLIVGEDGQPVAAGELGELCAGGDGVALGYLNRPDLTARAFRPGPDGRVLYHTGDRARMRLDGVVEFAGRTDREVKIGGKRVALDEMEAELRRDPGVQEAAILMQGGRAAAYVTGQVDGLALRHALLARLPDHMVPATVSVLDTMPLTRNGKLDRKALSDAALPPPAMDRAGDPDRSQIQARIGGILRQILGHDLAPTTNFFDGGAGSLDLVRAQAAMADAGLPVTLTDLFAHPSIASLVAHLGGAAAATAPRRQASMDGIAVIGMAGRFPGADDVDAFWRNVKDGTRSISRLDPEKLEDAFPEATRAAPAFVAARPILPDTELFDAEFFGMHAREAALADPQHRVFLEMRLDSARSAGYDPATLPRPPSASSPAAASTPISCATSAPTARGATASRASTSSAATRPCSAPGQDFLATRVAYKLDLRGPAHDAATACSTSLVAVAQACAGAAACAMPTWCWPAACPSPARSTAATCHEPGGIASADGTCRPFDAAASGTVFGSGAGVVLLKRLPTPSRRATTSMP